MANQYFTHYRSKIFSQTIVLSIVVAFLFLTVSCEKDTETLYPVIQTGEVTEIDSTGATFHAKIIDLGTDGITEYGFIWRSITKGEEALDLNSSNVKIESEAETGVIHQRIDFDLAPGVDHHIRSYAKNGWYISYGRVVSFYSEGSLPPVIYDIFPTEGTSDYIITIVGDNFSNSLSANKVVFATEDRKYAAYGEVLEASKEEIVAKYPSRYWTTVDVRIGIETSKRSVYADSLFKYMSYIPVDL